MDIQELRDKINKVDDQLSSLFAERMRLSAEIGEYKLQNGMNIRDAGREDAIIKKLCAKEDPFYAPFLQALYAEIFALSRMLQTQLQEVSMITYGLVGQDIAYSYEKWIQHSIGNRTYGLYDLSEELLPLLFKKRVFRGLNIARPYRKSVLQYCDRLGKNASETGYVNTIIREADHSLTGYNTACEAILRTAGHAGISFAGKKVMIFGNGAIASSAAKAAKDGGAREIIPVTRTGQINFTNCVQHKDIDILINGTSIGMAPDTDFTPAPLDAFPALSGVLDAIYTPVNSRLITQAGKRQIPCVNGLSLLIEKSLLAAELFGFHPAEGSSEELYEELTSFIA